AFSDTPPRILSTTIQTPLQSLRSKCFVDSAAQKTAQLPPKCSQASRANAQSTSRRRSSNAAHLARRFEHFFHSNRKYRRVRLIISLVSRNDVRCSQSYASPAFFSEVRPIALRVRRPENRDDAGSDRISKMQWPRISPHHEPRSAQKRHQLSKTSAV